MAGYHRAVHNAITSATAAVDQGVLRLMQRTMERNRQPRPPRDARRRLIELARLYNGADDANLADDSAFFPAPDAPEVTERTVQGHRASDRVIDLTFASTYRPFVSSYAEELASYNANLTVHARYYCGAEPAPTIICLHGWGGGAFWLEERAFVVSYLRRIGLDVVLFQLPFHGERTPKQAVRSGALFPSAHVVRTNEAFGQAIHDLRALALHLKQRGAPAVGVTGMSLGGYTTALWASVDPTLAFAIPMIPAVSMSELMWRHGSRSPSRRLANKLGVDRELLDDAMAVHAPLTRRVKLDKKRLLVVAGRGDRITPPDQARKLAAHWGDVPLYWFPGGHLAQIGRGDAFRMIRRHLAGLGYTRTSD